jgi:predicted ArsR family transcriptional regulator
MLLALVDSQALSASELAYRVYLSSQTASSHLAKIVAHGLLAVEQRGRHLCCRMASREVG